MKKWKVMKSWWKVMKSDHFSSTFHHFSFFFIFLFFVNKGLEKKEKQNCVKNTIFHFCFYSMKPIKTLFCSKNMKNVTMGYTTPQK